MDASVVKRNNSALIQLVGRFEFNAHREFRAAVRHALEMDGVDSVAVDMNRVSYLDSSALGMLLVLRDKASGAKRSVTLAGVTPGVRQVLDIANFGKLFAIS